MKRRMRKRKAHGYYHSSLASFESDCAKTDTLGTKCLSFAKISLALSSFNTEKNYFLFTQNELVNIQIVCLDLLIIGDDSSLDYYLNSFVFLAVSQNQS